MRSLSGDEDITRKVFVGPIEGSVASYQKYGNNGSEGSERREWSPMCCLCDVRESNSCQREDAC